jgi:Uma2 family endonuclease
MMKSEGIYMATVVQDAVRPQLHSGDRLSRDEFHRAYSQAPKSFHAELIGGVVYVASPVGEDHAFYQSLLVMILASYATKTPGVRSGDNATLILGDDTEPQPDVLLRIEENYGGSARKNADGYVEGPP